METSPQDPPGRRLALNRPDICRTCNRSLPTGTVAHDDRYAGTVRCPACLSDATPTTALDATGTSSATSGEVVRGVAGGSARREHERRRANDEARLRRRWGRWGAIAVLLSDERRSTRAWATGAVGEERLGARLDKLPSPASVLHDRRIPGSRANIDHLVVTPAGVWVVDAKRYRGRPHLRVEGGITRPRVERLVVGRRDRTKLVDSVVAQVALVRAVVEPVPVTGTLCFVDADWPLVGGTFTLRGVDVVWPKRLTRRLSVAEGRVDVPAALERLAAHFPSA